MLITELIKYLLSDETEDEDANEEYVEDTNRDAVMIAAAKLVLAEIVPKVCAAFSSGDRFSTYNSNYNVAILMFRKKGLLPLKDN